MIEVASLLALGVVLGAVAGSFAGTILIRWPQGRAVSRGRSECDTCGTQLGMVDLIPILSHLAMRGSCRRCDARIDGRHLGVEVGAALIGATAFVSLPLPDALVSAAFGWWLLLIACLDFEHHWLPDVLTLPLLPAGLAVAYFGVGPPLLDRAIGGAIGGGALWLIATLYRAARNREGLGAGDPKLFAGLGAWLGWAPLPFLLLGASVLGLLTVLMATARGVAVDGATRLPFGTLLSCVAWPMWLVLSLGFVSL